MKKYFFIEEEVQKGPFSINELREKNIHKKTLVWEKDMENWEEAKDIIELKEIIKIIPPPLPSKNEKIVKVEAKVSRNREKILTPNREKLIAKETKQNFKFIKYSILVGLVTFVYFVYDNQGFAHKSIEYKLKEDMSKSESYFEGKEKDDFLQNRENLKRESISLGYDSYSENYFSTDNALKYHSDKFNESLKKSIVPSLLVSLISSIILIFGRYLLQGAKWVEEKSIN